MSDRDERRLAAVYRAFGVAATWTPAGAPGPLGVTLNPMSETGDFSFDLPAGPKRLVGARRRYRMRASESVALGFTPKAGDAVHIGAESLKIVDAPTREDRALSEWTLGLG